ncbi:hypothetical protein Tco_1179345 [Tanacetum coccineum]
MADSWYMPLRRGKEQVLPNKNNTIVTENPTITQPQHATESQLLCDLNYPIFQFVAPNFNEINAMYLALSSKVKQTYIRSTSDDSENDHPFIEVQRDEFEEQPTLKKKVNAEKITSSERPLQKNYDVNILKGRKERETSKSTTQQTYASTNQKLANHNYELPDGIKVPSNLRSYDGLLDPDDHLTMFMGTMDVLKISEPAWCKIFNITLCGGARFWRFQKNPSRNTRCLKKSEESLKDYLAGFEKKTLHMTDRSDGIMTGAFISGLRPGRIFKDITGRLPMSLEDLYPSQQDHGCGYFKWKDEITFGNASSFPRPSTPSISSSRASSSSGPSGTALSPRNAECSNCKLLTMKIKILEARLAMERHPDDHACQSAEILHELLNEMENLRVA